MKSNGCGILDNILEHLDTRILGTSYSWNIVKILLYHILDLPMTDYRDK